ncbi:MAG: DivIVA domain-containing protein [Actinomycetota bacterium]|nr:DivIVA domain-containing protein [Actinomycetota bacterium]
MALTREDVKNKTFTPVRLREGYDMGEVDQFLDEVESELERLQREAEDLRSKLSAAQHGGGSSVDDAAVAEPAPAAPPETIKVTTAAEASGAATRLLELATRNADELVNEARAEAEQLLADARSNSEQLHSDTLAKTEQLEQKARKRSEMLDSETEAKRRELFDSLEEQKARLEGEVDNMRAFEREYRSRLKSYFNQQLEALQGAGDDAAAPASGEVGQGPRRLRSILGEDSEDENTPT